MKIFRYFIIIVRKMQMKKVFMYFDNHRFRSTEFRKVVFKIRLKK